MKIGSSLKQRALLVISVILFAVLAINTAVLTAVASRKYRDAILSKSASIGQGLQGDLSKVLELGIPIESLEGSNEKLQDIIKRNPAIGYGMITDAQAKILYHTDDKKIGTQLSGKADQLAAHSDEMLVQSIKGFYDIALPLKNAENVVLGALRIGVKSQHINQQVYILLVLAVVISLICFALAVGLVSFSVSRFIVKPIADTQKAADRMAAGDLTYSISVKGEDEIALLQRSINHLATNLKEMIRRVAHITSTVTKGTEGIMKTSQNMFLIAETQKRALDETSSAVTLMDDTITQVSQSAETLNDVAADTSSSIFEMSASIGKIADNAGVFSEAANETASSIEEMVSTIKQIAQSLENLSSSSESIASSIEEVNSTTRHIEERASQSVHLAETVMNNASEKGSGAAVLALQGMEDIRSTVASLTEVINQLGKKNTDIGKIINVIDDVADQTNLLAINAAILASKAGEHGKGFAVVADEIKSLAERTSFSTSEISTLIKAVQSMTGSSMTMASNAIQTVEKGLLLVNDVNTALNEIVDSARASTEMAKAIRRATTEEALAVKQITDSVEGMTVQTENISRAIQEQSRGSRLIVDATDKVKNLSHQVRQATNEQRDGSRQITTNIEQVTGQTAQISGAISGQKDQSRQIVQSMEKIRGSAGSLIEAANAMKEVVNSLMNESEDLVSEVKKFRT